MVEFVTGNLLDADVEALVNAVNTRGVMGKGIALQFKHAYPENFKEYRAACAAGEVRLGHMLVVATGRLQPPAFIINFPTKGHWKSRSRLADIDSGLRDLRRVLQELEIASVAVPRLGSDRAFYGETDDGDGLATMSGVTSRRRAPWPTITGDTGCSPNFSGRAHRKSSLCRGFRSVHAGCASQPLPTLAANPSQIVPITRALSSGRYWARNHTRGSDRG